jgi:hypothetical protein
MNKRKDARLKWKQALVDSGSCFQSGIAIREVSGHLNMAKSVSRSYVLQQTRPKKMTVDGNRLQTVTAM